MKIVVLDYATMGRDFDLDGLRALGEVTVYDDTKPEEMRERLADADAAISNRSRYTAGLLRELPKLRYIGLTATGTNTVDLEYTHREGIVTTNVKGYSSASVIQHTFALYFAVAVHLKFFDDFIAEGCYARESAAEYMSYPFHELAGKTWGIIGLGAIGRGVADIAKAFGCRVIYYSTGGGHDDPAYTRVSWDELLEESDVISVHAPLNESTRGLVDAKACAAMKKGAILVNVGRGAIVDADALAEAIRSGRLAGAGLDVFDGEPIPEDSSLMKLKKDMGDRLILTPHVAWASVEARQTLAREVAANLEAYLNGEERNRV